MADLTVQVKVEDPPDARKTDSADAAQAVLADMFNCLEGWRKHLDRAYTEVCSSPASANWAVKHAFDHRKRPSWIG